MSFLAILRSAGAVAAGLVVAFVLIIAVEAFGAVAHPVPPGVDLHDFEQCKAHVARIPAWVLAVVVVLWAALVFVSAWLATRLGTGRRSFHGMIVGVILLALAAFNMCLLPYPLWFEGANLVALPLATIFGARLARGKRKKQDGGKP